MGLVGATLLVGCDQDAGVDDIRYRCGSDRECGEGFYCYEPSEGSGYCVSDGSSPDGASDAADSSADAPPSDTGASPGVVSLRFDSDDVVVTRVVAAPNARFLVVGRYKESLHIGTANIAANGDWDGFVLMVGADGTVEWLRSLGSGNESSSSSDYLTCADMRGDEVLVGGKSTRGISYGARDILARTDPPDAGLQGLVVSSSNSGDINWSNVFGTRDPGGAGDTVYDLSAGADGHTTIGGIYDGCLYHLPQTDEQLPCPVTSQGMADGFLIDLDDSGAETWRVLLEGGGFEVFSHVAASSDRHIGFVAEFQESATLAGDSFESLDPGNSDTKNRLIGELDARGNLKWAYVSAVSTVLRPRGVDYTAQGMVLGGEFRSSITLGNSTPVPTGEANGFVTQLDHSGDPVWFDSLRGDGDGEVIRSIQVDDQSRILVGAIYTDEATLGATTFAGRGGVDSAIAALDPAGEIIWSEAIATSGDERLIQAAASEQRIAAAIEFSASASFRDAQVSDADGGIHLVIFDAPATR